MFQATCTWKRYIARDVFIRVLKVLKCMNLSIIGGRYSALLSLVS